MRTKPADQSSLLAAILLQLRGQHATSRSTLAKVTQLSPSTVGIYVDHLTALGYVAEGGLEQGKMGRPQRRLSLVEEAGWFAGVEFNAERIQAVRVDFAGKKELSIHRPLPPDANTRTVLNKIKEAVVELSQAAPGRLLSMGVGVPGLVNPTTGVAMLYSFIPDWRDVPLVKELRRDFPVHVTLENNLRAVALAERWFGSGREMDDYVILGPRRGFGIAIMKNGQLVHGSHLAAGEIGRWPWPLHGSHEQQLHDVLTAPAVWRRLSGADPSAPLPTDLRSALQAYAGSTSGEWNNIITDYARVISVLHLVLDAQTYFLHGPLTVLGERFCQEIQAQALQITPVLHATPPQIRPSILGDEAGALGAASLAMEAWTPEPCTAK
jgi:predicted NBD/HSP70 family sugar kinase